MVVVDIDGVNNLYGDKATAFIKKYFGENLPTAEYIEEYEYSGFWGIKYFYKGAYISFDSDRGGLRHTILIDNKEIPLWQLDESVKNAIRSNDKDILAALNAIKKFFKTIQ